VGEAPVSEPDLVKMDPGFGIGIPPCAEIGDAFENFHKDPLIFSPQRAQRTQRKNGIRIKAKSPTKEKY
jgi:hypothetical protein